jgi:hypothetical protein
MPRSRHLMRGASTRQESAASGFCWSSIARTRSTSTRVLLICAAGPLSSLRGWIGCRVWGSFPERLVAIERQRRCSVTRRAARRAERGALDRRRAGATGGCVRAGAHAYLGPRPCRAAGRRHDGDGVSRWGKAVRPLGLWRPSTRAWRQQHAGSRPRCIGVTGGWARTIRSCGCDGLLAELAQRVVAALEQLARDRQARAVVPEPLGRLQVIGAIR